MSTTLQPDPVEAKSVPDASPTAASAAALIAAGIGAVAFGIAVVLTTANAQINNALILLKAVGPLSGKAVVGIVVYLLAWLVLAVALRGRRVDLISAARITVGLTAVAVVLTFPPVFELFA